MKLQITPDLIYLSRNEWGADERLPRIGYDVPLERRTHAIMHHTVMIDPDPTPNVWENMEEVKTKMQQLQTIRPDLGLDVPYNDVGFLMGTRRLVVCEGRGEKLTGAHTKHHNTKGYALALCGNFELARDIGPWIPSISRFWGWRRYERGMWNLGTMVPPAGQVFGHQEWSNTACPGAQVMAQIEQITFAKGEDDDMVSQADFDAFVTQMKASQDFQNASIKATWARIDYLAKIADNHEKRIKALGG